MTLIWKSNHIRFHSVANSCDFREHRFRLRRTSAICEIDFDGIQYKATLRSMVYQHANNCQADRYTVIFSHNIYVVFSFLLSLGVSCLIDGNDLFVPPWFGFRFCFIFLLAVAFLVSWVFSFSIHSYTFAKTWLAYKFQRFTTLTIFPTCWITFKFMINSATGIFAT